MMKNRNIFGKFELMKWRYLFLLILTAFSSMLWSQIAIPSDKGSAFPVVATNQQNGKLYTISTVDATPLKEKYEVCIYNGIYWQCLPIFEFNNVMPTLNEEPRFVATSVCEFKGAIYLGGKFEGGSVSSSAPTLYKFNGDTWETLSGDIDTRDKGINKMIVWQDTLIAAGNFTKAGGTFVSNIAKFDGISWQFMGRNQFNEGANGEIFDLELINDYVYIAGNFTQVAGQVSNSISRWKSGEGWTGIGKPFSGNIVYNLEKLGKDIVAIGQTVTGDSTIRIFKGGLWQMPSSESLRLVAPNSIAKPVVIDQNLFLYGPFLRQADTVDMMQWNGTSNWSNTNFKFPKVIQFQQVQNYNMGFGNFKYTESKVQFTNLIKLRSDKILVSGTVFGDLNANCVLDGSEQGVFANVKVINKDFKDQFYMVQTNNEGTYQIELNRNEPYEIEIQYLKDKYNTACSKSNITAISQATHIRNLNLGLDFSKNDQDLQLHSTGSFGKISPNNKESALYFYASNAGNLTLDGNSIHLDIDSSLVIQSIIPTPADFKTGKITWTLNQLNPGKTLIFKVILAPINKNADEKLFFTIRTGTGSIDIDADKTDNFDTLKTTVLPQDKNNFKTVSTPGNFASIDELNYGIYFTNNTGKLANSVTIIDTFDTDLPLRQVRFTNYSHENSRSFVQNNIFYCTFNNINLIKSEDGLANASGFFEYKFMMKDVKQKFVDQEFTNTATIHFDYTDFRVTNTVSSILSRFTSIENLKTDLDFNAYPNPASNQLFVMSKKKAVFNIYSAIGEKVLQTELTANETTSIDISTWASGIYIISNGTSSTKFVVQH